MLSAKELNLIVTEGLLKRSSGRLCASTAKSMSFIPNWETKILHATRSQHFKKEKSLKLPDESAVTALSPAD